MQKNYILVYFTWMLIIKILVNKVLNDHIRGITMCVYVIVFLPIQTHMRVSASAFACIKFTHTCFHVSQTVVLSAKRRKL